MKNSFDLWPSKSKSLLKLLAGPGSNLIPSSQHRINGAFFLHHFTSDKVKECIDWRRLAVDRYKETILRPN